MTAEQKLEKATTALAAARKQIQAARRLLQRSMDALPSYTDGRNDRLEEAIEKWLETK